MICLDKTNEPDVLREHGATWTAEYVSWCQLKTGTQPRRYAHPEIRDALESETRSKCAYCEGLINDVAYSHIEHMRPKSLHPSLVCDWDNLTIACPKCNVNKGDYNSLTCPLLDPYVDQVEEEIAFGGPFAFARGGPRSKATIVQLDLNRKDLLHARVQVLEHLVTLLDLVERSTGDPALRESLWLEIDAMTDAQGEFASVCRQFVASQTEERGLARP